MIKLTINEHELKSQLLDEIISDINAANDPGEQQDGEKPFTFKLGEQVKNFIISEFGCDYESLNGFITEMIDAINEDLEADGIIPKGSNKKDKKPFDFSSDKLVAYRTRDYEAYRNRMAEQRKSIKRKHITFKDHDIKALLIEKIREKDMYDLDIIMSICRELNLTLGYRFTDNEIIATETLEGTFCGHLYKEIPIYESGKYKVDDYNKRIEVLTEAMMEMNAHYYDVQIDCWYASDKTNWR